MTQEDKDLLLKDLCGRLSYRVKGIITYDESNTTFTVEGIDNNVLHLSDSEECHVEDFKPYLRPMLSMTDKEKREFDKFFNWDYGYMDAGAVFDIADWINTHHFDYRGLIEKGLALEALEGMYGKEDKK